MNDLKGKSIGIVCLSGGMDSCVTAAIAIREVVPAFLHVNYGQRTEERERRAFQQIADFYRVPPERRLCLDLDSLHRIGGSALTDKSIPVPKFEHLNEGKSAALPATYVPFRNTLILSLGVAWAEVLPARCIYIGAVSEDSAGYPDCRPEYYEAFNKLIELGSSLAGRLKVVTPLINMRKREIIQKGREWGAPFHLTWTCYENSEEACGRCDSCLRRLRAFHEAGVEDPIPYK
jgi:7-cyano-7-deazaguanine synthase